MVSMVINTTALPAIIAIQMEMRIEIKPQLITIIKLYDDPHPFMTR